MRGRTSLYTVALYAVSAVETLICTGLALYPLHQLGILGQLSHFKGLIQLYSLSLSNLDIWLLSILKNACILILIHVHGTRPGQEEEEISAMYKKVRRGIRGTCITAQLLLLGKATVIAINAPDNLVPIFMNAASSGKPFVGLVMMFSALFCCLLCSFLEGMTAVQSVRRMQTLSKEAREANNEDVTAPLLPSYDQEEKGKPHKEKAVKKGLSASAAGGNKNNATISELLLLSRPDAVFNCIALTAGCVAALCTALVPYYTGLVIDFASIEPDRSKFVSTCLILVLVAALGGIFTGIRGCLFSFSMNRLNVRLRKGLFHSLVQMEMAFFDTNKVGDISSRLSSDTTAVSDQISLNINVMMRSITQALLVIVFMLAASWRLTTITFVLIPLVMTVSSVYGKYYQKLSKELRTELAEANAVAEEVLSAMSTVKAHAAQDSSEAAYHTKLESYSKVMIKQVLAYCLFAVINTFLPNALSAAVLFYGGTFVLEGKMSPGSLVSFMLYQQSLSSAFQAMADVYSALTAAVGAADKVMELIKRKPEVSQGGSLIPSSLTGRIEFQNVVFNYPSRPEAPVIQGLSLIVNPGEVVALVGPSGGGKSSIVRLIERFYLPTSGQVLLDERDIGMYKNKWLRQQVALVSQEPVLCARSVRRNIIYGLEAEDGVEPPSNEEIEEAARQANAHDFIMGFPDGYETNCWEKGTQLSGGQKQRIAIARALVRKPRVLLLDEATSALDADSEAVVQEALDRIMANRTTLVIAHRLSTVQHADKIIVIAKGVVQEVGNHEGLLAAGGMYATLVKRQLQRSGSTMSFSNPSTGLEASGSSILGPRGGSRFTSQASLLNGAEQVD
ncbi:hypothetical protein CEUSTIGMA_g8718.t1 [Chlamydomonas eustigma]|uniref:ATP-binding cassette transporter n=1 Tax=Chlamydomonas eustigma TaxID=1157962 RepID=A0A250XE02_9CHLO|nr:hypothetical protein CEUSTIGMA_g8718.t1 [Chlamydomonas eustigma]|eukprot:GAX81286.1 hypothetical protein CEUSTIGMA_g8718.t1 [Chlamydomonas eustigma]